LATINDVAKRAGVSVKTVSRLLSGYAGIRGATRSRIETAMQELEYFPSAAARSLRGKSTGIITLITDSLTTTPDSVDIVRGIQVVCEQHGKLLMIGETGDKDQTFDRLVTRFRQQNVEAIIKATMFHKPIEIEQSFEKCPLVLVNCFDTQDRFPAFVPDDRRGAQDLTSHLIALGHQRIAFITLLPGMIATELRLTGYQRALEKAGLALDPSLIVSDRSGEGDNEFHWLEAAIKRLLRKKSPPTAIMFGNDKMALRGIMHLRALGVDIPRELAVVGYDDFKLISENTVPSLTTAALPYYEMGVSAARLALKLLDTPGSEEVSRIHKLRCKLVKRDSDGVRPRKRK
jgi:LacI family transcriptional regulator